VETCPNRYRRLTLSTRVHLFPTASASRRKMRMEWYKVVRSHVSGVLCHSRWGVCKDHFKPEDYKDWKSGQDPNLDKTGFLLPHAVPSLNIFRKGERSKSKMFD
jgi:hypothetical protein